ncbi:MAG: hypothetical protein K2X35_14120 [Bryobacteraceae bacterium]|nr:hypothetical protein [Bryobacteraceae bacterium]
MRFCLLLLTSAALLSAGEKKVLHCFAFTVVDTAAEADWAAFAKATDELPGKVKGLEKVWHGKLRNPLNQAQLRNVDPEARKKLTAGEDVPVTARMLQRKHGACMQFADEASFQAYGASAGHKEWEAVYSKVRVPGTTTFQILGQ